MWSPSASRIIAMKKFVNFNTSILLFDVLDAQNVIIVTKYVL